MKKFHILLLGIIFTAACQQTATVSNSNSATNNRMANHDHAAMQSNNKMNHNAAAHDHSQMQPAPDAATAPYDLQFLDTMTAHHQGAVDMARMVSGKTENADLKKFAAQIIADQEKEINQMKQWRERWFAAKPSAVNMEMAGMADSMKGMDMNRLGAARGKDFDLMFIEQMIPHHAGAVVMSREALQKAEHAEIKTLAEQIIKAQEAEIKMMQDWKAKWTK